MLDYEKLRKNLVIIRGGGDIATGTIYKLFQCGFPMIVLEISNPSCIRRTISFCEAVFEHEVSFNLRKGNIAGTSIKDKI